MSKQIDHLIYLQQLTTDKIFIITGRKRLTITKKYITEKNYEIKRSHVNAVTKRCMYKSLKNCTTFFTLMSPLYVDIKILRDMHQRTLIY